MCSFYIEAECHFVLSNVLHANKISQHKHCEQHIKRMWGAALESFVCCAAEFLSSRANLHSYGSPANVFFNIMSVMTGRSGYCYTSKMSFSSL